VLTSADYAPAQTLFTAADYAAALQAFQRLSARAPLETQPLAGLALCYFALGKKPHARRLWKIVTSRDDRYLLPRFWRVDLAWPPAMQTTAAQVNALVV